MWEEIEKWVRLVERQYYLFVWFIGSSIESLGMIWFEPELQVLSVRRPGTEVPIDLQRQILTGILRFSPVQNGSSFKKHLKLPIKLCQSVLQADKSLNYEYIYLIFRIIAKYKRKIFWHHFCGNLRVYSLRDFLTLTHPRFTPSRARCANNCGSALTYR